MPKDNTFEPVSFEKWKEKIILDLKGKPYPESLTFDNFEDIPFQSDELAFRSEIYPVLNKKQDNNWKINCEIPSLNVNNLALSSLKQGAESLTLKYNSNLTSELKGIQTEIIDLEITVDNSQDYTLAQAFLNDQNIEGSVCFESIFREYIPNNKFCADKLELLAKNKTIVVPANEISDFGGNSKSELKSAVVYIAELLQTCAKNNEFPDKLIIKSAVNRNFLIEIAKLRALRHSIERLFQQFNQVIALEIHALTTYIDLAKLDEYNNLLRNTNNSLSAVLGCADRLTIRNIATENHEFWLRMGINIQHLLKEESFLNHKKDPTKGAHAIENLTADLCDTTWDFLLKIESEGGVYNANLANEIELIKESRAKKTAAAKEGDYFLLGVNHYVNPSETAEYKETNFERISQLFE